MSQSADLKYYKWGEFVEAVRTLITVDSDRLGLQDTDDGVPAVEECTDKKRFTGFYNIPAGVNSGQVTGLLLPFNPTEVRVTVAIPENGEFISAVVVVTSYSTDGFKFVLSGITDSTGYVLNYEICG